MFRALLLTASTLALMGCELSLDDAPSSPPPQPTVNAGPPVSASRAASNFRTVVARVEPVAERMCRARTEGVNCDFLIFIDEDDTNSPNAFQTLDKNGRPVIGFNRALIADARNQDELAFILGHEAAHHIEGHIATANQRAVEGAVLGSVLSSILGVDPASAETLTRASAGVNARRFSKGFELEADRTGTVIAARAGYDPVRGAAFFQRIPDPGDRFLGTHPPNAERINVVRQTAAQL